MPRHDPPQQPPPMQWLRMCYSKLGTARFASHRDFSRAFERALRRCDVPMAYSSGFSPHPRISYANAAPTSAESYAEYLDIGLAEYVDSQQLKQALNATLPAGFRIEEITEQNKPSLTDLLQASEWLLDLGQVGVEKLKAVVDLFFASEKIEVTRRTKKGDRVFDVRSSVLATEVRKKEKTNEEDHALVWVRLRHGVPLVRPDDVLRGLRVLSPELAADHPGLFTRLTQGQLNSDGTIGDPLSASE